MPVLDLNPQSARLRDVIREATQALADAGIETPGLDARRLVAAATGLSAAEVLTAPEAPIDREASRKLTEMLRRRCAREPVSRILGERGFYGRAFAITPATLDPRPDSETLIELALEIADEQGWRERPIRILDVGTGSGCLLVTLLAELPQATGTAVDINADALEVAAVNARRHGVMHRANFEMHDGLSGIDGDFDLMICNPPYVASHEISGLSPEVRNFDPRTALDGGPDGLGVYRALAPALARVVPRGWVVFEVGAGQAGAVAELLRNFVPAPRQGALRCRQDLGGHTRCVAMEIQL